VSWLLRDHRERQKAKLAIVERTPATPAARATGVMMTMVMPPVAMSFHVLGSGETTVEAAPALMSHAADIDLDISHVKIYRDCFASVG
jgi:hypothetical protein